MIEIARVSFQVWTVPKSDHLKVFNAEGIRVEVRKSYAKCGKGWRFTETFQKALELNIQTREERELLDFINYIRTFAWSVLKYFYKYFSDLSSECK